MQITHLHQTSSEHVTVTLSTGEEISGRVEIPGYGTLVLKI